MLRAQHVKRFGGSNALESEGLEIVRHALEGDGRLTFEKCFEGARADFCVHLNDSQRALGVQLKTTQTARQLSKSSYQYRFSDTDGYGGLALLCIALDSRIQFWLIPGNEVTATSVGIPTVPKASQRYSQYQTYELDLADEFVNILTGLQSSYHLDAVAAFTLPTNKKGQTEFWAFQQLKERLPITFNSAQIEGSAYDHSVNGEKWQMKVATYIATTDRYIVNLQKSGGRIANSKKRKHTQYEEADFQWLCVQMPQQHNSAYLIPMSILLERRVVGRLECTTGTLHLYPHRPAHPKTEWTKAYRIDLTSQQSAISDYNRIKILAK